MSGTNKIVTSLVNTVSWQVDRQHLQPRHRIKRYQEHEYLEREIREEDRLSKE